MADMFGIALLFMSLILVIQSVVGSYFAYKKIRMFHESGVAILLGMILSAISKFCFNYTLKLDKQVFLYGFLPIIVFAEGFALKKRHFFKNMMPIILYGLVGTIITMILTAILTQVVTDAELVYMQMVSSDSKNADGEDITLTDPIMFYPKEILLFASAISSKDSFLASTMVDHHHFPRIFHIIFGEGIVNDATSLLLFDSFDQLVDDEKSLQWNILPQILANFVKSLTVSLLIGIFFGTLCSLILKHLKFISNTIVHEALIIFFCSFCSYSIVESLHYSGVVSLLFCGIMCGHFAFYNLSEKGMICSNNAFQIISSGAENCLFAYLGFTTFNSYDNAWSFTFIGFVLLFLLISRIVSVFFMSVIVDLIMRCFGKRYNVTFRDQIVLVFTGMSRGILGYILVQRLDTNGTQGNFYQVLQSSMVALIVFTTFFFGLISPKIVDCSLGTPDPFKISHSYVTSHEKSQVDGMVDEKDDVTVKKQIKDYFLYNKEIDQTLLNKKLSYRIQKFYILKVKPFLIRDYFTRYVTLQQCKKYFKNDKFDIRRPESQTIDQLLLHQSLEKKVASYKSQSINEDQNQSENEFEIQIEKAGDLVDRESDKVEEQIVEQHLVEQRSIKEKDN